MGDFAEALEVFRANRRIWEARSAPTTRVRDAVVGTVVKIAGIIDGDPALRAGLTLSPCVGYRIRCGERRDDLGMTQFFASGEARVPFVLVEDDGERVRIEDGETIMGAAFVDIPSREVRLDGNDVLTRAIGPKLAQRAIDVARRRASVNLEARLAPGDRVAVRGLLLETHEIVASGYRDAVGRGHCLKATTDQPLVLYREALVTAR